MSTPLNDRAPGHKNPALDCVRGIAISLVVIWHYFVIDSAFIAVPPLVPLLLSWTWAGVDVFFVLSGFLIGSSLLSLGHENNCYAAFYVRRLARVLPLYVLLLVTYVIVSPLLAGIATPLAVELSGGGDGAAAFWSHTFFLQNVWIASADRWTGHWLGPTWSLAVEMQFYALVPLLFRCTPSAWLKPVLACMIIAGIVFRCLLSGSQAGMIAPYVLLPTRCDAFLIGFYTAILAREPGTVADLRRNSSILLGVFASGLALLFLAAYAGRMHFLSTTTQAIGHTALAVLASILLLLALFSENPRVRNNFARGWLAALGIRAYGIYIVHQPVKGLTAIFAESALGIDATQAIVPITALILTLALADMTWRRIEAPVIAYAKRYRFDTGARAVA